MSGGLTSGLKLEERSAEGGRKMRNRQIPAEAQLYAAAFDAYLRASPDGHQEREAADRMTATLNLLAQARLSKEPVRAFVNKEKQAAA